MLDRQGLGGRTPAGLVAGAMLISLMLLVGVGSPFARLWLPSVFSGGSGPASSATLARGYARLPQSFEPNRGQSDPRVDFLSHGRGYSLFLARGDATLVLSRPYHHDRATALRVRLAGSSPAVKASGVGRLPGTVNYLRGHRPSAGQTAIPTYRGVTYRGVYPGVDLRYYGSQRQLEYDFSLAPNADPSRIALDFSGARRVDLAANGDLRLRLPGGALRERAPVAFQRIAGERRPVAARYVVRGDHVSFALGAYDRSRPLTIDPVVLAYSTYLGGASDDFGQAIAVDAAGSAYVTGWTRSTDFPTTAGAFDTTQNGAEDVFVAKLTPDGKSLAYSTYLGGSNQDLGVAVAVDSAGSAYVSGRTLGTDFPTTAGAFQTTAPGGSADAFVAKLAPNGQSLAYSTYLGGSDQDNGEGIAVDAAGSAYVTGFTDSANFPTTAGAFHTTLGGTRDDFVTKLAPDGKTVVYSTYLGGSGDEGTSVGVAVDSAGSAYVTGKTSSADFPTTAGAFQTTAPGGSSDAYVTKLAANGKSLAYSTYLGGSGSDDQVFAAVAVDSANSAYVTGDTTSANFPTTIGAFDTTLRGSSDAFVTKLAPDGKTLAYSTYLGGSKDEIGAGVAVDPAGSAYLTGDTFSADFPTTADAFDTTLGGSQDAFVTKLAPDGKSLAYSTYLGGSGVEDAFGIAVDLARSIYVDGVTFSADFPTTAGAPDTTSRGSSDAYVAKLGVPSATVPTTPGAPSPTAAFMPSPTQVALGCANRRLTLTDVHKHGRHVSLAGIATRDLIGRRVIILFDDRTTVATAVVGPNGVFTTTAPLPPPRLRHGNHARYLAEAGGDRSLDLKLFRRLSIDSITVRGGQVTIKGEVTRPLDRPPKEIVVQQVVPCAQTADVARKRPRRNGHFEITFNAPRGQQSAIYRLMTEVRHFASSPKLFPTFTLPEPVALG